LTESANYKYKTRNSLHGNQIKHLVIAFTFCFLGIVTLMISFSS